VTRVNLTTGEYEHLQNCLWGESVYLVGSGPSLIGYDYSRLKGKTTIGVNHGLFELVNAGCEPKFHVFLDQRFLQEAGIQDHQGHIGFDKLPAYCVTSANSMISPRVGKLAVISAQNREAYKENKPPTLAALKESGGIEYSADGVICLWRDKGESERLTKDFDRLTVRVEAHVLKNRNGELAKVKLDFTPAWALFTEGDKERLDYTAALGE